MGTPYNFIMPTKESSTLTVRVPNNTIAVILERAKRRKLTKNAWLTWAINDALRSHGKR